MPLQHGRQENDNPTFTAVDDYAVSHLIPQDSPFYQELNYAATHQRDSGLPDIAVSPLQGKFLALQCMLTGAKHALEFGTLGAYSTIWIASKCPRVTSIEYDAKNVQVSRHSVDHAGLSDRVEVLHGAGVDVAATLKREIEEGKRQKYDFVFIDADKLNNLNYLNAAIDMCNPNACIIVDNVVRRGRVASEEIAKTDESVRGSREVIEAAGRDPRLDATMIQTVGEKGYDGFMMAVVK